MRIINLFLIILLAVSFVSAETTHPFSVHDMLAMDRLSGPQVSPDGQLAAFTLRKTDLEANKGRTDIWVVGSDGTNLKRLTSHSAADFSPRWSADGKSIWFLSARDGSSQVWKIRVDGGEAEQVTDLPLDVGNLVVSPDGKSIAFTAEVFVECSNIDCTKKKLDEIEDRKSTGVVFDRTFIRHWDTWKDGRRSHLFVMPIGGKPVDVMAGMDADTPSKPFGGAEEITFTPDGTEILFSARYAPDQEPWSTDFDLYRAPIDGSSKPKCITQDNKAWDTGAVFSNDGKTLAYLAMKRPGYESDRFRIVLMDWATGKKRVLTEKWDRSPGGLCWSADDKEIYATAMHLGQHSLFAVDADSGIARMVVKDGFITSPSLIPGNRVLYAMDNLKSPVEFYSVNPDGSDIKAVTQINKEKVAAARMGDYEQFTFKGWKNQTVYCYVVKPVDFDPNKKYPVAFLIHGGPQGSFGNHFHYRWNPQAYTGAGYVAVMVDFHGSTGYGQDFTDSIRDDWGGKPLEDLQKGLKAFLQKYPWADKDRIGALGASYGGFMINWIQGNWQGTFKCLVNHDGVFDNRMAYFDTEELWFPEWEHMGTPWINPKGFEKHNPVNYIKNWETPMLVIHGELDFRVTVTQGIGAFNALQRRGIESKLLYFPDENHWVLKPHNSIQWHNEVIGWLDKFLK